MRTTFVLIFICRTVMGAEFNDKQMLESVLSELDTFKSMMETCNLKLGITESIQTRLASLEEENEKLSKRVRALEASFQAIKQPEFLNTTLEEQTLENVSYKPKRDVRSQTLSHLTQQNIRQIEQSVARIAFTASVSFPDLPKLGDHQTIIFDSVMSNIGQAYHPYSGTFLAPVKGVYVFTVTLSIRPRHAMYFEIVSDGSSVAEIYADSLHTDSLVSATRQWIFVVNKSSEVFIRTRSGGEANGSTHTSFSGFLLCEME